MKLERVAIVGSGGAGKTTFARELGRRTGIPVVHLDQHFWKPGWVATPRDEWRRVQSDLVAGSRWIVDGNYGGTFDIRFSRADTVIVLQPCTFVCVVRLLRRSLGSHGRCVQASGCPEHLDPTFLRWVWRYRRDSRPRLRAALDRHEGYLDIIVLSSRRDVADFLEQARNDVRANRDQFLVD